MIRWARRLSRSALGGGGTPGGRTAGQGDGRPSTEREDEGAVRVRAPGARQWAGALSAIIIAAGALLLTPSGAASKTRVGEVARVRIESPHPYPSGDASRPAVWSYTVQHPGASLIKLHFSNFDLGRGDVVRIFDGHGNVAVEYTDRQNAAPRFWAPSIAGDTAVIELQAGGEGTGGGIAIDRYAHAAAPITTLSTCGSDQKEDIACHAGGPIETSSRAVGRLLFEAHGALFACTGFLISAQDHFLTNRHCISGQASVDSAEVLFGYQRAECGEREISPGIPYAGDRLVRTSKPLDMALMTLAGHPSGTYGFLPLAGRALAVDEPLYLPQHPNGGPQMVSVLDCRVSTSLVDGASPASDFGHRCDTEPGSSGSPVLDLDDTVVGLHRAGACTEGGGENSAVLMSRILPLLPPSETTLALDDALIIPAQGSITLSATLLLGRSSNGVAIRLEPVALTLADADGPIYSVTVPGGILQGQQSNFVFSDPKGKAGNGLRRLSLRVKDLNTILIFATVRGVDLHGADRSDLTVRAQIGDDGAAQTVTLRPRSTGGWVFP